MKESSLKIFFLYFIKDLNLSELNELMLISLLILINFLMNS